MGVLLLKQTYSILDRENLIARMRSWTPLGETGHPYLRPTSRRTNYGDVHEVSAFGTLLSKLVSSQPPGAEAHIVDPL